jgi:adenylylsulfate kinase-like enzyme
MKNIAVDETLKDEASSNKKQVIWMAGYPCAGKTFMGDYLATRGWHHIDGDQGGYSKDPIVKEKMMMQWAAM